MQEKNSHKKIKVHDKYIAKELQTPTQAFNKYFLNAHELNLCNAPVLGYQHWQTHPPPSSTTCSRQGHWGPPPGQPLIKSRLRPICSPLLLLLLASRGHPRLVFHLTLSCPSSPGSRQTAPTHRAKLRAVPRPSARQA